jgi:uncharacterized protein
LARNAFRHQFADGRSKLELEPHSELKDLIGQIISTRAVGDQAPRTHHERHVMTATKRTRRVVQAFFDGLLRGDLNVATRLMSDDLEFELPVDRWSGAIPRHSAHRGMAAFIKACGIRAADSGAGLEHNLHDLRADGEIGFATILTRSTTTGDGLPATRNRVQVESVHRLVVGGRGADEGKIVSWTVFSEPGSEAAILGEGREEHLVRAIRSRDAAAVADLIRFGAEVNHREPATGLTPLMIAAGLADLPVVRLLIGAGADVMAVDSRAGASVLHKAVQGGDVDVVAELVQAGAFLDAVAPTTGHTPLTDALWFSFPAVAGYLLSHGAGLDVITRHEAVGRDRPAVARELLEDRLSADREAVARQRLLAAVNTTDVGAVRRRLAAGDLVDERCPRLGGCDDGHTPLLVAARDGHTEIVRELLAAGADVNAVEPVFGAVALHKAVANGHAQITAFLLDVPGVNLDAPCLTSGYTPLHDAVWHGYEDCARLLVEAGADLTPVGHDGKTALQLAIEVFGREHPLSRRLRQVQNSVTACAPTAA